MSTKIANAITIIGGVASLVIILGLFGVDAKFVQDHAKGLPTRVVWLIVALLVFLIGVHFRRQRARITPEKIESKIRQWVDAFNLGIKKLSDPALHFGLEIRLQNNQPLNIFRMKEHPHYLTFVVRIKLSPEHKAGYEALADPQQKEIINEVALELARAKITSAINLADTSEIERLLPITNALNEAGFINTIQEMALAMVLFGTAVARALDRRKAHSATGQ